MALVKAMTGDVMVRMPIPVSTRLPRIALAMPPPSPFGNGETEFADMRAAYDALPEHTKDYDRALAIFILVTIERRVSRLEDHLMPPAYPGERRKSHV